MDGDYSKKKKEDRKTKDGNGLSDLGDILQPSWVRCPVCTSDEMDRFLFGNRLNLLCHVSPIFWIILFFDEKFK